MISFKGQDTRRTGAADLPGDYPLVYSPTSRDVVLLGERLRVLFQKPPLFRESQIAVVATACWPLPWYFRIHAGGLAVSAEFQKLNELERVLSRYVPDIDIACINAMKTGDSLYRRRVRRLSAAGY